MRKVISLFFLIANCFLSFSQQRSIVYPNNKGLFITGLTDEKKNSFNFQSLPLFSCQINDSTYISDSFITSDTIDGKTFRIPGLINGSAITESTFSNGWKITLTLRNISGDTIKIANVMPFGYNRNHVMIAASDIESEKYMTYTIFEAGKNKIYIPGKVPIPVFMPDNGRELCYNDALTKSGFSFCAISRRVDDKKNKLNCYASYIAPLSDVKYVIYIDTYKGEWQKGLNLMFNEHLMYDTEKFDNSLYEREDLKWIRNSFVMALQFSWDVEFYNADKANYNLGSLLDKGEKMFGGYDIFYSLAHLAQIRP